MSAILDNITGGGLLPHIYCKKVTLENSSEQGLLDVTLSLELCLFKFWNTKHFKM